MNAQNQVLDCFPFAESRQAPPIHLQGQQIQSQNRQWSIFAGPDHDAILLGRGRTEAIAWADAAEQLELVAA